MKKLTFLSALLLVLASTSTGIDAQQPADGEGFPARVIRRDGKIILQSAIKTYSPAKPEDSQIVLLGNFHAGTREYFESIQKKLDQAELVLFEAPGRPSHLSTLRKSDKKRASRGKAAGKYIAAALAVHSELNDGQFPDSLNELIREDMELPTQAFLQRAISDSGWGEAWEYQITDSGFELIGLGADGLEGGKRVDKDLRYNQDTKVIDPFAAMFRQTQEGRQTEALTRMDFVDQGAIINYSDSKFVLSDIDNIQLKSFGIPNNLGPPDMVGDTPRPQEGSDEARLERTRLRIRFINMNDPAKVPWMYGKNATGRNQKMFELMVVSRNDFVMDDLKWLSRQEEKPDKVHVLYGAGHMLELETRLLGELGYRLTETKWLTVCEADEE